MKKTHIKEIREKSQVAGTFLVTRKETGVSKSGKPYLNMRIMDSTGELEARVWDDAEALGRGFNRSDVVALKGFAVAYQGGIQVNVSSISALKEGEYSIRDFLPSSKRGPGEMMRELDGIISSMKDAHLRALLTAIFSDPRIREMFSTAPAAKTMHHPYLGGLLEHVLSICGLAEKITAHYGNGINRDLLTAGAILHDIGKIYELSYMRAFEYTDIGRLIGHITIGVELIDGKIRGIEGFPAELAVLLKHMILSHHGLLEYGSPKRPKTLEAIVLYYLDDMDAKVNAVQTLMEAEASKENPSGWSAYQKIFERYIYTGGRMGEGQAAREKAAGDTEEPGQEETLKGTLNLFK